MHFANISLSTLQLRVETNRIHSLDVYGAVREFFTVAVVPGESTIYLTPKSGVQLTLAQKVRATWDVEYRDSGSYSALFQLSGTGEKDLLEVSCSMDCGIFYWSVYLQDSITIEGKCKACGNDPEWCACCPECGTPGCLCYVDNNGSRCYNPRFTEGADVDGLRWCSRCYDVKIDALSPGYCEPCTLGMEEHATNIHIGHCAFCHNACPGSNRTGHKCWACKARHAEEKAHASEDFQPNHSVTTDSHPDTNWGDLDDPFADD